jgi:GDP/UDP-N,N'-diacetylbacillosamine 2-epimerase (hydrolysing)
MVSKICVVTGTRAEYGLLRPLIEKLNNDRDFNLKIVSTGMHLSSDFGLTYKAIEEDGYIIDEKIEILSIYDNSVGIANSMSKAISSFAQYFESERPDLLIVLGDRYEILAVSIAATLLHIPIAHLHGGEITEGAYDEPFRHSITKMSHLHFASTEKYKNRIIQLGENPKTVFNVGAIGVENIIKMDLMTKNHLEKSIDFKLDKPFALVTFHPVTLENSTSEIQVKELIKALDEIKDMKFIVTKANSDTDGRIINKILDDYYEKNKEKVILFKSMGQLRYLSAMKYCDMVIGNSSSGIIEAPVFKVPTINIGDRQKGRIKSKSIINCDPTKVSILESINKGRSEKFKNSLLDMNNFYGDGNTSELIVRIIKEQLQKGISLKKKFYDLEI